MGLICTLITLYTFILLARVLLSWFPQLPAGARPVAEVIYTLTEPVLRWARPLLPPLRIGNIALDMSILLLFVGLSLLQAAICP
ncbi:MAG: YggT family protein [Actinomycetota bacterium]